MLAILDFSSMLIVALLLICTCTYLRSICPLILDGHKTGWKGIFWKCARIGERCSPYVSGACLIMAMWLLIKA